MTETNINTKGTLSRSIKIEPISSGNSISNLPKITSLILPKEFEILPNSFEVLELEFAFYEYKFLTQDEIIHRGAFFKSIDGISTYHYISRRIKNDNI